MQAFDGLERCPLWRGFLVICQCLFITAGVVTGAPDVPKRQRVPPLQPIARPHSKNLPPLKETRAHRLQDISTVPLPPPKPRTPPLQLAPITPETCPRTLDAIHASSYVDTTSITPELCHDMCPRIPCVNDVSSYVNKTSCSGQNFPDRGTVLGDISEPQRSRSLRGDTRQPVRRQGVEPRPVWHGEREKLRQNRKLAEKRNTAPLKPVKATREFTEKKQAKESEPDKVYEHGATTLRQSTTIRTKATQNQLPLMTSGNSVTESESIRSSRTVTPSRSRGTECSKKGVGFQSKARLAKLKAEEEAMLEKERRERERLRARIPATIRKNFVKYGFG